ncbi:NAD(P)/FAD-dependent oxidoreductase [bacterium]|nr:NAD(P)/FAD-dependent oxidoreductase [bacterium]
MDQQPIQIVGTGPAGLTAAIFLARHGRSVTVHDRSHRVGSRFGGDFQGLQNWVWRDDTLEVLRSLGIEVLFRCIPFKRMTAAVGQVGPVEISTDRPLFYLVERGEGPNSLDTGLRLQAEALGVHFNWGAQIDRIENGYVIDASGPQAADIIAKGIVFETDHADTCMALIDNGLAPKGYAYLLIHEGQGTLATCIFEQFARASEYYDRTLARFHELTSLNINNPVEFGGYGNFDLHPRLTQGGRILHVGEAAGFQDYLWGFGMHYAMLSGYLAARSVIEDKSYEELCGEHILPMMRTSLVNRWLFSKFAPSGFPRILRQMKTDSRRAFAFLHEQYQPTWWKDLIYPAVARRYRTRLTDKSCMHQDCDCIWCRKCRARLMDESDEGMLGCQES